MATALNVAGLSVAFAAFMVIMMQVTYDRGFDRMHPQADRIFRADLLRGDYRMTFHARALLDDIMAASPRIEAGTLINPYVGSINFIVGEGSESVGFREPVVTCYPEITRIFGFSFTEGDAGCLTDPEKVIIPQSMARRMFGREAAVGRQIVANQFIWTKEMPKTLTVGGVYRDFPGNTQLDNAVYTAIDRTMEENYEASNFICYLLIDGGAAPEEVEADINRNLDFSPAWNPEGRELSISIEPLTGIYLSNNTSGGLFRSINPATVRILLAIALLIVFIAGINFTNFSIAMAPSRVRSINTQKVFGCSGRALKGALVSEALAIAFVSWAAALLLVGFLDAYRLLSFMEADMDPLGHPALMLLTGGVALLAGLLAGLYPAWYVTSFQPAMALKGSFALSAAGRRLRIGLTGFQYVISAGLLVGAAFIQLQNNYVRDYDQGFSKDRVAIVELSYDMHAKSSEAIVNGLKEYPGIEEVAFAKQKLGARDSYTTYMLTYADQRFGCYVLEVSPNFLSVMGVPVIEGRDFTESDAQQPERLTCIFNRPVWEAMKMKPGDLVDISLGSGSSGPVAGLADEVKMTSLRRGADPIVFVVNPGQPLPNAFVRIGAGAGVAGAVEHIRSTIAGIDPYFPFDIEFYDDVYHSLYQKEERMGRVISWLSLLAIIISVIGVFGLVVFDTQYRRREIGIRKVHGATVGQILVMFNGVYMRIVCVCFVIGAPVAWYAVSRWLENFAYRTPLYWWVYCAAFAIVAALTVLTVTFQSRRAANANPAESINAE
jgi:putative ABC transport system permease protein